MAEGGVRSSRENDTAGNGPIRGSAFSQIQSEARMCSRNSRFALAKSEVAHHLITSRPGHPAQARLKRPIVQFTPAPSAGERDEIEAVMVRALEATNRCRVEIGEFMGVMMTVST